MADLGKKHECLSCGVKFYDFGKAVIVCPKCGANQAELSAAEATAKPKAKAKKKKAAAPKKKKDAKKDGDVPDDKVSDEDKKKPSAGKD